MWKEVGFKMLSQIAPFELRMYFVPGAYGLILASVFARVATGVDFFNASLQGGDLTQSFAFVFASYIIGHLIQSVGHGIKIRGKLIGPEQRLKLRYWGGYYPSERALFKNAKILSESNRKKILDTLLANGTLDAAQRQSFEGAFAEDPRELAQSIFVRLSKKAGEKVDSPSKTTEALYQMLRGFFFSSWLGLIFGLSTAIYSKAVRLWCPDFPQIEHLSWPGLTAYILFCLSAWLIFRYRCRGAGEGFAREVYLSALTP
jgi:hypothetical protein